MAIYILCIYTFTKSYMLELLTNIQNNMLSYRRETVLQGAL